MPANGADARVKVTVRDAAGTTVVEELAPMTDDGGSTFVFTVPPAAAPGQAAVVACAEPMVPLLILAGTGG